ncbi:MAG: serine/threonine dehydratase [Acidimicrobiia bacterium]|nr:serine/threonine dehydratase [Acidimicrobiia bacterium]
MEPRPGSWERDILEAADRLNGMVRHTPVLAVDGAQLGGAGRLSLKLELLQHSGSFKARGATNFMLANPIGPAGVVAASGGNHGAAVAWAASRLGYRAAIFVPTIASPAKVERLRRYGADVHQVGAVYADALAASRELEAETGATPIHAYEDRAVMAGAATVGRELERQAGPLDTVLVACGGGGLSGGIAAWLGTRTRVVACETEGTATFAGAREAGRPVRAAVTGVAADALGATQIGELAWQCLAEADALSVLVTDAEVAAARAELWDRFRLVTEPAAAVPVAALLAGRYRPTADEHVGVVICGANTDLAPLPLPDPLAPTG